MSTFPRAHPPESLSPCRLTALLAAVLLLLGAGTAGAVGPGDSGRNFDARDEIQAGASVEPGAAQRAAIAELRAATPSLAATFDHATGATRSLSNQVGYLSPSNPFLDPVSRAVDFVGEHLTALGLSLDDVAEFETSDVVYSAPTGATHVYLRQTHQGLAVYNGLLQVGVNRDGRVLGVSNSFLPDIARGAGSARANLSAGDAVASAAAHLGLGSGSLGEPSDAVLMWLPVRRGSARLVWNFQLPTVAGDHVYDFTVDAVSGKVWTRFDQVADADYRVYEQPVESPNHTTPAPPNDGRTLQVDPQDAIASEFGWHDTNGAAGAEFTIMRGNNAHAYEDSDGNNAPPGSEPDCGGALSCDFAIDLTQDPSAYQPAAVANLFYWNNVIHDVQYQYGFDEAGGNFQVNNYGNGGAGGDDVRAEAQDGGGNCNANFLTPADGSRPRMQMFTCTNTNPAADGDLDNGVIVHEYGHGISNRQVGGPNNVGCLGNNQQPGEGWSDWLALAYTAETGDAGSDARGIGTYLFGQPANGPGIRPAPYSTDFGVNDFLFADIGSVSIPHGVGFVWATIAWEAYWEVVNFHGFDANLYNATGGAGNQRMMLYINEGLKNTACGPTFIDVRDGVIQAANDNHGGEDVCRLWTAFARRGLGTDASARSANNTRGTNGFSVPAACQGGGSCGDNTIDPGETCDGTALGGETCASQNCTGGGTLACLGDCSDFDTSGCSGCPVCIPPGGGQPCTSTTNCCNGVGNCTGGKPANRVCN